MNNMDSYPNVKGNQGEFCPYLGLKEDPKTSLAFPSPLNICFHAKPATPPSLKHQRLFCLSKQFPDCPVYAQAILAPLPPDIGFLEKKPLSRNRVILPILLGSTALIFGVIGVIWALQNFILPGGSRNPTPLLTTISIETDTPIYTDTPSTLFTETRIPTRTRSRTSTVTPSRTATPTSTKYGPILIITPTATSKPGEIVLPTNTPVPQPTNTPVPTIPINTPVPPATVPATPIPTPPDTPVPPTTAPTDQPP